MCNRAAETPSAKTKPIMKSPRVIISGGGTGGHIFPAIAIADAIKAQHPDAAITFVGAKGKMEMEKVPAAGYPIEGLWISGLQRRLTWKNLLFPIKVVHSLWKARSIVRRFSPDVAVGVGGYASGPLLRAAGKMGVKTVLQEQNGFPGMTNKMLAAKADKICVAYRGMEQWFPAEKLVLTGNPVREKVVQVTGKREQALRHFGLLPHRPTVLAVGGSLGARTINESLLGLLDRFESGGVQLIWQTGKSFGTRGDEATASRPSDQFTCETFIREMDLAYAAADVIISRAGAISISELTLVGKPTILIPSPNVAEDHQTKNAMALVEANAAILVKDGEAREVLGDVLFPLVADELQRNELSRHIQALGKPDAADHIARIITALTA